MSLILDIELQDCSDLTVASIPEDKQVALEAGDGFVKLDSCQTEMLIKALTRALKEIDDV